MAKFTTAFSLSHEVLNEIENKRGNENRSAYVDSVLKKALGITEREIEELRSHSAPTTETGYPAKETDNV